MMLLLLSLLLFAEESIRIEIKEKEPLKLVTYGEESTTLVGSIEVTITNRSDSTQSLLLWEESHNLYFRRVKDSGVLVHSCAAGGYAKSSMQFSGVSNLILEAGQDTTILYDSWSCSSPFHSIGLPDFYKGGEYTLRFRILPYFVAHERRNQVQLQGSGIIKLIEAWSNLLHSEEYWRGAYESNKLSVRLKPKRK